MTTYNDYPFDECVMAAVIQIKKGATVHQKFTCCKCGSRQTISEPDKFFTRGICEECKTETDIKARGCNFLVIWSVAV